MKAQYDETKKYKGNQKLYSQWAMVTLSALEISPTNHSLPTRTHNTAKQRSASESSLEPTIRELRGMTESIAEHIYQSGQLPEGTREALTMLSALLTGRRECSVICRVQSPGEGLTRSSSDAGHDRAIDDFTTIQTTLQNAVAFVSPRPSPSSPLPVPGPANRRNFNSYEVLGDPESSSPP